MPIHRRYAVDDSWQMDKRKFFCVDGNHRVQMLQVNLSCETKKQTKKMLGLIAAAGIDR